MSESVASGEAEWERQLANSLPAFGHRNWIVVADSAYPAQANPGIDTIVAGEDHVHVIRQVLNGIRASIHLRANVYVDRELEVVAESDAPGITEYRQQLDTVLYGATVSHIPHERIIHELDQCARLFKILVIKTGMTIPYTSVFFELDCGYWNAEAEERVRQAMPGMES
ncbi:MAG: RbsD/FucU domain-containing protein [Terracidiphilus sp.]|jgi:D-ribose pyranose/furanose isomerase RbsD